MRSPLAPPGSLATAFLVALASSGLLSPARVLAGGRHATATAPAPTSLSLSRPAGRARYGSVVTLTARLASAGEPLAGRMVSLYAAGNAVTSATTSTRGAASFKVKATQSASYEARFSPASREDLVAYQAATSKTLALAVSPVVKLTVSSPLRAGRRAVGVPGVGVRIRGRVTPYVSGARVVVRVTARGREVGRRSRLVLKSRTGGRFTAGFKPRKRGTYVVRAAQGPSGELGRGAARRRRLLVVRPRASAGSRGAAVRALQRRLSELGYVTPVNGFFGASTGRAVLALRKVIGMSRVQNANRTMFRRLAKGGGAFRVRYPKAGRHVEFDWSRQVVVLALGARPVRIVHASSGKPSTPTVFGHYRFYSKTPGYNAKGMYYSNYFVGGYAIHGYADVPTYAASHGCIRIPIPSAISVYRWIELGDGMYVYR